jgi:hypothetical protein
MSKLNFVKINNLIFLLLIIFSITISSTFFITNSVKAQDVPLSDQECDQVIRNVYNNPNARAGASVFNTQVCLNRFGYFYYGGKYTTNYGTVTQQAAEAYINKKNEEPKQTNNQPPAQVNNSQEIKANPKIDEEVKKNEEIRIKTQQDELQKKAEEAQKATSATQSNNQSQANAVVSQANNNPIKIEDTNGFTLDKFIVNTIYFLFALPFILFAISLVMAMMKFFQKK